MPHQVRGSLQTEPILGALAEGAPRSSIGAGQQRAATDLAVRSLANEDSDLGVWQLDGPTLRRHEAKGGVELGLWSHASIRPHAPAAHPAGRCARGAPPGTRCAALLFNRNTAGVAGEDALPTDVERAHRRGDIHGLVAEVVI